MEIFVCDIKNAYKNTRQNIIWLSNNAMIGDLFVKINESYYNLTIYDFCSFIFRFKSEVESFFDTKATNNEFVYHKKLVYNEPNSVFSINGLNITAINETILNLLSRDSGYFDRLKKCEVIDDIICLNISEHEKIENMRIGLPNEIKINSLVRIYPYAESEWTNIKSE